ncbi:hypothetical protein FRB99_002240 [Tulasnella sp. 403]|nr:hypothetical protein FRB99_002240 [Tulasnella sp. 403]
MSILPLASAQNPDPRQAEARRRIERAAYLNFPPAQYKLGWAYEYAKLGCPFDPLLSVQYYLLASHQGETEADMALSKWFLCGSEGAFDKDEALAMTFAEKAAKKGLPSAEFAMGYYCEVGIGGSKDLDAARKWYQRAISHNNPDAAQRLAALSQPVPESLSRAEHDALTNTTLVRKRTSAKEYSIANGMGSGERRAGAELSEARKVAAMAKKDNENMKMAKDGLPMPSYPSSNQGSPGASPRTDPRPLPNPATAGGRDRRSSETRPPQRPGQQPLPGGQQPLPGGHGRFGRREDTASSQASLDPGRKQTGPGGYRPPANAPVDDRRRPSPPTGGIVLPQGRHDMVGGFGRRPNPSPGPNPNRKSYALSDSGPISAGPRPSEPSSSGPPTQKPSGRPPSGGGPPPTAPPPAPSPSVPKHSSHPPKKGPETFAEMGFHSAPVQDKDCIIM